MNAISPLATCKDTITVAASNKISETSTFDFQQLLSLEIDGRIVADSPIGGGNANLAKPDPPKVGKVHSPPEEDKGDQSSLHKLDDPANSALIDTSSLVAVIFLSVAAAQNGQAALKADGIHEHAKGDPQGGFGIVPQTAASPAASLIQLTPSQGELPRQSVEGSLTLAEKPPATPLGLTVNAGELSHELASPIAAGGAKSIATPPIAQPHPDLIQCVEDINSTASGFTHHLPALAPEQLAALEVSVAKPNSDTIDNDLAGSVALSNGFEAAIPDGVRLVKHGVTEPALPENVGQIPQSSHLSSINRHMDESDSLPQRVGSPDWGSALGQKVVWMIEGTHHTATLTLNPPDLGPMRIVLNLSDNQIGANFISAQPEVRAAIEAAMPRLHEMMESIGIQLSGSSVGSGASNPDTGNGGGQAHRHDWRDAQATRPIESVVSALATSVTSSSGQGMIDTHV